MRLQVESRNASATSVRASRWTSVFSASSLAKETRSRSSSGEQRKSVPTSSSGGSGVGVEGAPGSFDMGPT